MVVAEEHGVDRRQIQPGYSGLSPAPRTRPRQRTRTFGPYRVRQNVGTRLLKEHRGVVHESGSQHAAFHAAGWFRLFHVRDELGRRFRTAGQLPSEDITKPAHLRSIRIEETLSVKVLRKSRAAGTLLH